METNEKIHHTKTEKIKIRENQWGGEGGIQEAHLSFQFYH